ncbi:MAG: MlaD family protein [Solirubrobacterales bacterium]
MSAKAKAPGRLQRTISGGARRLESHTTALGIFVALVGALLAYVAWISVNGVPFQDRYLLKAVVPASSPILKGGDAVRIAGRLAGLVTDVQPHEGDVLVEMELEPGFAPVGEDASTNVRVKSLIYLTYLEIYPGDLADPMPEGGTIPVERSGSGVDLLEVVELFDRKARESLSGAVYNAGLGVAGRGAELNVALKDLAPATEDLRDQLEAATSTPGAIRRSLRGAGAATDAVQGNAPGDVAGLIVGGEAVVGALASQAGPLGETIDLLRPVSDELIATAPEARRLLAEVTELSRILEPAVADLQRALPDVLRVLALGDVFRIETARLTSVMNPVLRAAGPVLRELRPVVASIEPLLEVLDVLVERVAPYEGEIRAASEGLISATKTRYPGGTAPDTSALRFAPIFTCHRPRDPYPEPGETATHSQSC